MFIFWGIFLFFHSTMALIGYDCGAKTLNVTTLSLLGVDECDIPENNIEITKKYVQLLQVNDYSETRVIQCKIEIHRTVYYCGMHSHVSIVLNGENEYIYDISKRACTKLHETGSIVVANSHLISGVKVNNTITHGVIFAGYVNHEGKCNGAGYSDPYGTWESVVVQGTVKITLSEYIANVKINNNNVHLRSGTVCPLSSGSCLDIEGGNTFWDPIPRDNCNFHQYGILYEGMANKMVDKIMGLDQTVYSLTHQDITFALNAKGQESVCGYTVTKTEHPKLVIFETIKGESFAERKPLSVSNLDIFAYVNSKFVYVEKHLRSQINLLYRDVLLQRCSLEKQTLKNSLSIATQSPDEFAYDLMKGPGYMAVVAGEVVHIIKCVPVEVKIEHGDFCYGELQVSRNNKTYFLTPRTHILKSKGTRLPCNSLVPSYYFVGQSWYKILPQPVEAKSPMVIKPMTKPTWKYVNPQSLATSGIYREEDLEQLRERIMFPVERPALLNDLAREMRGHPILNDEGSMMKLLNDDVVEKIMASTWDRFWTKFLTFGTVSAAIIAILMIIQFVKTAINIIIQGVQIHAVYGWSIHLLGAVWTSMTHFLIYLGNQQENKKEERDIEAGQELMPQPVQPYDQQVQPVQNQNLPAPAPRNELQSTNEGFFKL